MLKNTVVTGLAALIVASTSVLVPSASFAAGEQVIKIGVDFPVSGADAASGIAPQNGAILAIEEANKRAPAGVRFEAYPLDDAVGGVHNPQQGATNMKTFVADPAVLAVVGPFNSNVAAAEIPIGNAAGLAEIAPSTTNPKLTKTAQYRTSDPKLINFARVCSTDDLQGKAGASAAKALGFKKAYIVDDNETYGKGLADVFEASAKADGITVLGHDHITPNQQDFRALLTKVAAANPDVFYWGGVFATGGGLIRQQMASAGIDPAKVAFFSGDDFPQNKSFLSVAGAAANNTHATIPAPNVDADPAAKAFVKAFTERFHTAPSGWGPNGYVAAQVAVDAILRAYHANGNAVPTRAAVIKAVQATNLKNTVVGPISFDENGDVANPSMSLWEVKNNAWVFERKLPVKK